MSKLLTIAIPTYNRAKYLNILLESILIQIEPFKNEIDIIVSDNASTDNTPEVVEKYIKNGLRIQYYRNEKNLGAAGNSISCFKKSQNKYFLLCGDDDVLLDGALEKIMPLLKNDNFGIIYLNQYSFREDFKKERPKNIGNGYWIMDIKGMILKEGIYFTFISGNILNMELIENKVDHDMFLETNLSSYVPTLESLFSTNKHVYIQEKLLAARLENSGGYSLFKVFGTNSNIIHEYFIKKGVDKKKIKLLNNEMIIEFLCMWALKSRDKKKWSFEDEDIFKELFPVFKNYLAFWIFVVPIIFLPQNLAEIYGFFLRVLRVLYRLKKKSILCILKVLNKIKYMEFDKK